MMIAKHGGESHFVRPDFTYITGVKQPWGAFDPVNDVMATTNAFTLAPMQFQQGGLGRAPIQFLGSSPIRLMGPTMNKLQMWWARVKARWAMWGLKKRLGLGFVPYGPKAWAGAHVVPLFDARQAQVVNMGTGHLPGQFAAISAMANRYR